MEEEKMGVEEGEKIEVEEGEEEGDIVIVGGE